MLYSLPRQVKNSTLASRRWEDARNCELELTFFLLFLFFSSLYLGIEDARHIWYRGDLVINASMCLRAAELQLLKRALQRWRKKRVGEKKRKMKKDKRKDVPHSISLVCRLRNIRCHLMKA